MNNSPETTKRRALSKGIREGLLKAAPSLKRNRIVRACTWPVMTARYAVGDFRYTKTSDSEKIRGLIGAYEGESCFIIGNGPSLRAEDLDSISGLISFASNRIYKIFSRTKWRPTYYLATDRDFLAEQGEALAAVDADTIMLHKTIATRRLEGRDKVILINAHQKRYAIDFSSLSRVDFSDRPDKVVYSGFTVTYVALQLALSMGFTNIYLIGMDHRFSSSVMPGGEIVKTAGIANHAFADEKAQSSNAWNVAGMEYAYTLAREHAERMGSHIFNATRGGALEVFERIDLDAVLSGVCKGE